MIWSGFNKLLIKKSFGEKPGWQCPYELGMQKFFDSKFNWQLNICEITFLLISLTILMDCSKL